MTLGGRRSGTGSCTGLGIAAADTIVKFGKFGELYENTFTRTLRRGIDDVFFKCPWNGSQLSGATRVVKDLAAILAVGNTVFEDGEDRRCVVGADAVAGTKILIDPDPKLSSQSRAVSLRSTHPFTVLARIGWNYRNWPE